MYYQRYTMRSPYPNEVPGIKYQQHEMMENGQGVTDVAEMVNQVRTIIMNYKKTTLKK